MEGFPKISLSQRLKAYNNKVEINFKFEYGYHASDRLVEYTLHFNEALQLYCWIKRQSLNHANSEKYAINVSI